MEHETGPPEERYVPHALTEEQVGVLGEFADNMLVARRLRKWLAYLIGMVGGGAAVAYYIISVWYQIHPHAPHN